MNQTNFLKPIELTISATANIIQKAIPRSCSYLIARTFGAPHLSPKLNYKQYESVQSTRLVLSRKQAIRLSETKVPEGFTLGLALMDAVPVALFCAATVVFDAKIETPPLFSLGAALAFLGGAGKVSWKLAIALARKNVPWLGRQMRVTMPVGFLLMILGCIMQGKTAVRAVVSLGAMPSAVFTLLWIACMCVMGYFAVHRDQTNARDNWTEQITNAIGQAALLLAILFA